MGKTKLEWWKVRWNCRDEDCDDTIVSAVGYSREGAEARAEVLRAQGTTGVEVFESKPGSDEEI